MGWGSWGQEGLWSGVRGFVAVLVGSSWRGMRKVRSPCGWSGWFGWRSGGAAGRPAPSAGGGLVSVESDVLQCLGEDGDGIFK